MQRMLQVNPLGQVGGNRYGHTVFPQMVTTVTIILSEYNTRVNTIQG